MVDKTSDVLRIGIEIKTDDLQELQDLIQEISEAESTIRELRPLKGKKSGGTSRSAISGLPGEEFGIFGARESEAIPLKPRDKTSKQAIQREGEFSKLREQVADVEEKQNLIGEGMSVLTQASGFGSLLDNNKYGGVLKKVGGIAGKAFLPIAVITAITETVKQIIDYSFSPGGPLDRRFKREISKEVAAASEREEKIEIRQGVRVIRLTPFETFRGAGSERGLESYLAGKPQYDRNLELRSKGLIP